MWPRSSTALLARRCTRCTSPNNCSVGSTGKSATASVAARDLSIVRVAFMPSVHRPARPLKS